MGCRLWDYKESDTTEFTAAAVAVAAAVAAAAAAAAAFTLVRTDLFSNSRYFVLTG